MNALLEYLRGNYGDDFYHFCIFQFPVVPRDLHCSIFACFFSFMGYYGGTYFPVPPWPLVLDFSFYGGLRGQNFPVIKTCKGTHNTVLWELDFLFPNRHTFSGKLGCHPPKPEYHPAFFGRHHLFWSRFLQTSVHGGKLGLTDDACILLSSNHIRGKYPWPFLIFLYLVLFCRDCS